MSLTTEDTEGTERATPETDAQITTFDSISKYKKRFKNKTGRVSAEFARKLERERDEAREVLKTIASWQGGLGAKWPMEIARDFLEAAK